MKRVFPLIVLLITLSVLGIMFIQMHWIQNAILVKRELHKDDIDNSVMQIKERMYSKYFEKRAVGYIPSEESRQYNLRNFTIMNFSEEEVKGIIDSTLKKN